MTDAQHPLGRPAGSGERLRRSWVAATALLTISICAQPVLAGLLLSGAAWAREAHRATAAALIVLAVAAALAGLIALRRTAEGRRLILALLWLSAGVVFQAAAGALSAKGLNLLWLHLPLGVALVGQSLHATALARRLG